MSVDRQWRSLGIFYSWWRGDVLPTVENLPDIRVEVFGIGDVAPAGVTSPDEFARLTSEGNRLSVAFAGDEPATHGWNATTMISIGELNIVRPLAPGDRYLWRFITRPEWRGRRIYPWLLQAILNDDREASHFWIGHEPGNDASARGILTAGFSPVGEVFECRSGERRLVPISSRERAEACGEVFGIPIDCGSRR